MAIKEYSKVNDYITMLGTGNALATRCHHDIHNCLNPNGCWLLDSCKVS